MAQLLTDLAAKSPDVPALVDEDGSTTWRALDERVNRLINGLRTAGVATGDRVAIASANRRELFELTLACMHSSVRFIPINWHWTSDEIAYVLDDASCTAVLADDRSGHTALAATGNRTTVVIGRDYEELLATSSADEPPDQGLGVPMFYTSGTTGRPKGVQRNIDPIGNDVGVFQLGAAAFTSRRGLPVDGVTLLIGPAYHAAQWTHAMMPLLCGSTLVMRHRFDPEETLRLIDAHGVTNVHMVPTQFVRLLRLPQEVKATFDGSSLHRVEHGAAPCSVSVKRQMIDWWGPKFLEYYGGTEFGIVGMIESDEWLEHPGSVGCADAGVEVVVVGDDGGSLGPGEHGQLFFRNTNGMDFSYHGDPAKTASVHSESGFATLGDVGYVDDDGFIYLTDRKIDMIISGGVNIYPAEIESVLIGHPAIADVAVFGVPDAEFGERVMALIELVEGAHVDSSELDAFCRASLAGYKVPRVMEFTAALGRDDNGKLSKHALREPYWAGEARRI